MSDDPRPDGDRSSGASADEPSPWAELLADAEAIADEYRADGWTVERVEAEDVAPWSADADGESGGGFVVLAADDAFDRLESRVTEDAFASAEVYRRRVGDAVLAIAVELDAPTETAIVLPLYYRPDEASVALDAAADAGELQVRVRPAGRDDWLTFVHDEPALFAPDENS